MGDTLKFENIIIHSSLLKFENRSLGTFDTNPYSFSANDLVLSIAKFSIRDKKFKCKIPINQFMWHRQTFPSRCSCFMLTIYLSMISHTRQNVRLDYFYSFFERNFS